MHRCCHPVFLIAAGLQRKWTHNAPEKNSSAQWAEYNYDYDISLLLQKKKGNTAHSSVSLVNLMPARQAIETRGLHQRFRLTPRYPDPDSALSSFSNCEPIRAIFFGTRLLEKKAEQR